MGETLSTCAWIPHDGRFVKPALLSLDDLPREHGRHEVLASQLEMKLDEVVLVFGFTVFVLGLLCGLVKADPSAYRFGGVTVAMVVLLPRMGSAGRIAFHRFAEVSIGIAVALIFSILWPDTEDTPAGKT
jgi:uncharacterized membrane protein YccC